MHKHPLDLCQQVPSPCSASKDKTTKTMKPRARRQGKDIFLAVNDVALPMFESLCARWLPGGRLQSREWVARNPSRNDRRPGSFRINVDTGMWADFAVPGVQGGDPISLRAYLDGLTQIKAARLLADELGVHS